MNHRPVGTDRAERLDGLAATAHGAMCLAHLLGAQYHLSDPDRDAESWLYAGVHIGAAAFSAVSALKHAGDGRGERP